MIATILPSSGNFHAVLYNENKVNQGKATLIDIRNIPFISELGSYEPEDLQKYLISYSARNTRIQKPQFHIAISCKGHEHTVQELVEFANQYLERMGYDINTMPMAIYAHHDTDNTHIHIVTSRVAPDGLKIEHSHERRRSQTIVAELEKRDHTLEKDSAISEALEYDFASPQQFCAVLSADGYDSKIEDDTDKVLLYKHGCLQGEVPISEINGRLNQRNTSDADKLDRKKRLRQLKAYVKKYQALSADRQELQTLLKKKFGIDLVFYGKADSPYGYALIDRSTKRVYAGKEILPVKRLLDFPTSNDVLIENQEQSQSHTTGDESEKGDHTLEKDSAISEDFEKQEQSQSQTTDAEPEIGDDNLDIHSVISKAFEYNITSTKEFCAILRAAGYKVVLEEDWIDSFRFYKHGRLQGSILETDIEDRLEKRNDNRSDADKLDRDKRLQQIKMYVKKYQALSEDWGELQSHLKGKFGIDLVFYGKEDEPFAYVIVDHSTKRVFEGDEILPIKDLLNFSTSKYNHTEILAFIKQRLDQNEYAGTYDINKALAKKYGKYYLKGKKLRKSKTNETHDLPPEITEKITLNDKLAFAASFAPANDNEIAVLSEYFHLPDLKQYIDNLDTVENMTQGQMRIDLFTTILETSGNRSLKSALRDDGFAVREHNNTTYIIDVRGRAICNADDLIPNLSTRLQSVTRPQSVTRRGSGGGGGGAPDNRSTHNKSRSRINTSGFNEGSHSFSREWEVGQTPYENNSDVKLH